MRKFQNITRLVRRQTLKTTAGASYRVISRNYNPTLGPVRLLRG